MRMSPRKGNGTGAERPIAYAMVREEYGEFQTTTRAKPMIPRENMLVGHAQNAKDLTRSLPLTRDMANYMRNFSIYI